MTIVHKIFNLFNRVGIFYLIVFLIFYFFIGLDFKATSEIRALNRLMPDFQSLVSFTEDGVPLSKEDLVTQERYFKNVLKHMTGFSAAYEMLGVTYFYQNKFKLAEESLKKAAELNPHSYWFIYNLALFYYKTQNYTEAIKYFTMALEIDPRRMIKFMHSSKVYLPLFLLSKLQLNPELGNRLQAAYEDGYLFLMDSYLKLEDYESVITYGMVGINTNLDQDGIYYYHVGLSAYLLKDFKTSVFFLQESSKKNPKYANAAHYLGLALHELGKTQMAENFLEQAKQLKQDKDSHQEYLKSKELQIY